MNNKKCYKTIKLTLIRETRRFNIKQKEKKE